MCCVDTRCVNGWLVLTEYDQASHINTTSDFYTEILTVLREEQTMYTTSHFIWLAICSTIVISVLYWLKKNRLTLKDVLSGACIVCVVSELVKTLSVLQVVPSSDGTTMHLYIELNHLPLHLCSIQILFIFYARFGRNHDVKETLLAFMYPSCTLGAALALAIPTTLSRVGEANAFTHPQLYQFFLYHSMLLILGVYIAMSREVHIRFWHYLSSMGILGGLGFASIYLNAMFASPTYMNGELVSVDYSPNYFFT